MYCALTEPDAYFCEIQLYGLVPYIHVWYDKKIYNFQNLFFSGILENKKNENLFFVDKSVKKPKKISGKLHWNSWLGLLRDIFSLCFIYT